MKKAVRVTGKKLRRLRWDRNLTIQELADKAEFSWGHIQRMEKGRSPISLRLKKDLKNWGWIEDFI